MVSAHPNRSIHQLSLLSSESSAGVHSQKLERKGNVTPIGNDEAQAFWLNQSRCIDWIKQPTIAYGLVDGDKRPTWYPGATLNTCYNALDRHALSGYGNRPMYHHYSPLPANSIRETTLSYSQVLVEVNALAGVLRHKFGVKKGDTVVIYFPMINEGCISMLACARIGAVHSTVFGGFAALQLTARLEDAQPKVILVGSCGLEPKGIIEYKPLVDLALQHSVHKSPILVFRRKGISGHALPILSASKGEYDWETELNVMKKAGTKTECVEVGSSDPLYILFTSGTTAAPKGVVRFNGGHAVTLCRGIQDVVGLTRDSTIFSASDIGWVVGHVFCVYAPGFLGCASVIFEGKPILPDAGVVWSVVEKYKVNALLTAPTALRAIQREDADSKMMGSYNLSSLRSMFLAGERSEPGIVTRYQGLLTKMAAPGVIVVDNYWSTESGFPITSIMLSPAFPPLAARPGSAGIPTSGMDLKVVDDEGVEVPTGTLGNIVLGTPLPPSALGTVWKNDQRYHDAYFKRYQGKGDWFDTGDAGVIDDAGFVSVLSRGDDLINTAGHRLGTSLIEQVVASHPFVAECCVVGLPDELKGHVPFAVVIRANSKAAQEADLNELLKAVNSQVRSDIGAIASLGGLISCRIPKTRSGKSLRRTIKTLVENAVIGQYDAEAPFPPTIEDATAVDDARYHINEYFKAGGAKGLKLKL